MTPTTHGHASFVIVETATGRAVCEVWQASVAAKVNTARYTAVPILAWLCGIAAAERAGAPAHPSLHPVRS